MDGPAICQKRVRLQPLPSTSTNKSKIAAAFDNGLEIDDRSAVDRFESRDLNAVAGDVQNSAAMQSDGVRAIRRSGGKHACH